MSTIIKSSGSHRHGTGLNRISKSNSKVRLCFRSSFPPPGSFHAREGRKIALEKTAPPIGNCFVYIVGWCVSEKEKETRKRKVSSRHRATLVVLGKVRIHHGTHESVDVA